MLEGIEKRATDEARYLAAGGCTVRQTAQAFGVSKSTVYKDLTERLPHLDGRLYRRIRHVLDCNKAERHLRGGRATQEKFEVKNWRKLPENNLPKRGTCGRKNALFQRIYPHVRRKNSSNFTAAQAAA